MYRKYANQYVKDLFFPNTGTPKHWVSSIPSLCLRASVFTSSSLQNPVFPNHRQFLRLAIHHVNDADNGQYRKNDTY